MGQKIIVGTDGKGIGHVYAFEQATGKVLWKYPINCAPDDRCGIPTDILRIRSNIYGVAFGDRLICLDLKSGRLKWSFQSEFSQDGFSWSFSPAVKSGRVFLGGLDGYVYALDVNSGRIIWQRDTEAPILTALSTLRESLYVGTANGHIFRLNRKTGAIEADFKTEMIPWWVITPTDRSLLMILGGGGADVLTCLDPSLKKVRWSQQASTKWSSTRPHQWHGMVLVGNEVGEVFAYRATDGVLQWSHKFGGIIRSIGSAGQTVYVGTLKGTVYAYIPR